jgi:hypothetical protein
MRRMNAGMQAWGIGRMIAGTRVNNEMFDISAHIDRTLSYGENRQNISSMLGINQRNRGLESINQQKQERQRARVQRKDPDRQTGQWQGQFRLEVDRRFQAQRPGKRFSHSGRRYYERRANRSDVGVRL